jgi:hypothetical protein
MWPVVFVAGCYMAVLLSLAYYGYTQSKKHEDDDFFDPGDNLTNDGHH